MPDPAPMKTKDGRFGYEAAGDPAAPALVFLHGIGGAARGWRGQLDAFGDRYRAIAWDMPGYGGSAPLADRQHRHACRRLQDFLQQTGATQPMPGRAFDRRHDRAAVCWPTTPASPAPSCWRRPARRSASADGDWQKTFIDARLGPLDRGETMVSLAPSLVKELVGDDPDPAGMELARDCMAAVPEATYRAMMLALLGFDQRGALKDIAVPTLVLSGSKDNNAPAPMMAKMASYIPRRDAMSNSRAPAISPTWNARPPSTPRWTIS